MDTRTKCGHDEIVVDPFQSPDNFASEARLTARNRRVVQTMRDSIEA